MEDAIEQIVSYLKHAAQGLKRRSRSCICWGLWRGKSSLAERLEVADAESTNLCPECQWRT